MNKIGDIIATNRQNKQMTQEEFASRLGVTPQAVSKWERGQGLPDISLLEGICTILSIDANLLLGIDVTSKVIENDDISMQMDILDNMIAEPLMIEFGCGIIPAFVDGLNTNYMNEQRKKLVRETGILLPVLRIRDNMLLKDREYRIMSYDKILKSEIVSNEETNIFETLIDHVVEECKDNYFHIINKQLIKSMMDNMKRMYPGEIDGVIPDRINYLVLLDVMKEILKRNGTIRNQIKIVEILEKEYLINNNTCISDIVDNILEINN